MLSPCSYAAFAAAADGRCTGFALAPLLGSATRARMAATRLNPATVASTCARIRCRTVSFIVCSSFRCFPLPAEIGRGQEARDAENAQHDRCLGEHGQDERAHDRVVAAQDDCEVETVGDPGLARE